MLVGWADEVKGALMVTGPPQCTEKGRAACYLSCNPGEGRLKNDCTGNNITPLEPKEANSCKFRPVQLLRFWVFSLFSS